MLNKSFGHTQQFLSDVAVIVCVTELWENKTSFVHDLHDASNDNS